jgi:hypothetical protein
MSGRWRDEDDGAGAVLEPFALDLLRPSPPTCWSSPALQPMASTRCW